MTKAHLLKVKANLKKRQPVFLRQGAHKHKRVKKAWRTPKGLHSKMRDSRRGYKVKLQGGYQTPREVRGLDKYGLMPTIVAGVKQLEALDAKVHSLIIQAGLGGRKKLALLEEAAKKKFTILNAKSDAADKLKERLHKQHAAKKARSASKNEKQKELEAEAKKKEKEGSEEKKDEKNVVEQNYAHKHEDHAGHDHQHDRKEKTE